MKISVDSLYIGSIWEATPITKSENGKVTSIKYSVEKCSEPFIIRMEEEYAGGRLVANIPAINQKYQLRPTSYKHSSKFVNCEDVVSLREYIQSESFKEITLPKYIDSSTVEELERTYSVLKELKSTYEYDDKYLQTIFASQARIIIK